ncbi:uracil-DNA glycosylase [Cerasicoccus fimbriatus]|uniref:uracil-DNA glycosylase n=1 Tax=Cerasicoccus fimbriatus TaxID=3014554 RepID=UPI0022B50D76|nr:uracil-DNA glycosylase [Cerasicoccus sp. TK19100]
MRAQLEAVVEELKRWRDAGQGSVYLEPGTLDALRAKVGEIRAAAPAGSLPDPEASSGQGRKVEPAFEAQHQHGQSRRPRIKQDADVIKDFIANAEKPQSASKPSTRSGQGVAAKKAAQKGQGLPEGVKEIPAPTPFELPEGDKQAQWDWLREKVLTDEVCNEHLRPGKQVVFGVGNLDADIFFCGEAPGEDEEIQGEPFVGKAGQLLDKIIGAMGVKREQVYIGNIMNWRPEHDKPFGNRAPVEAEINYCLPYLIGQLEIVKPKVIVALGLTAANGLLGYDPDRRMGKVRGQWLEFSGVPLIITYHPSYLLRNQTNQAKRLVWEDMLLAMEKVGLPISEKQRGFFQG